MVCAVKRGLTPCALKYVHCLFTKGLSAKSTHLPSKWIKVHPSVGLPGVSPHAGMRTFLWALPECFL